MLAHVEWLAVVCVLGTGTKVGEFPLLGWRSVAFCTERRAGTA